MDRPLDLLEEYDLTSEERRDKRRAEFDRWFDKPQVRLYEAVMLSLRIVPQPQYRLEKPLPTASPPRYRDESLFWIDRRFEEFHSRMLRAIGALQMGVLKGKPDPDSANESDCRMSLVEFERWANKAKLPLPKEWRRTDNDSLENKVSSQKVKKQNNLLRIIRALTRAANIKEQSSLCDVVDHAPLLSPVQPSIVACVFHAVSWEDKNPSKMASEQRNVLR